MAIHLKEKIAFFSDYIIQWDCKFPYFHMCRRKRESPVDACAGGGWRDWEKR